MEKFHSTAMLSDVKSNILEIKDLLHNIKQVHYHQNLEILSGSSIGQHVRHILEFYLCLFRALDTNQICYDERERDVRIETDLKFAGALIDKILIQLDTLAKEDRPLKLKVNFSRNPENDLLLETSLYRELAYNLEHSIHHQALIKAACKQLGIENELNETFGVAPATIRYRNKKSPGRSNEHITHRK